MGSIGSDSQQKLNGNQISTCHQKDRQTPARVKIDDAFWNARIQVDRKVTIPYMFRQLKESPRWNSLKHTWKHGDPDQPHMDWDSDVAKFIEAVCRALNWIPEADPIYSTYSSWVEEAVDMIEAGQGPDGYFNTYHTVVVPEERWTNVTHNIELYDAGHLLEAAVTHYGVTKSTRFLDIMCRYVDYICTIFGPEPGKIHGYPGHQEIELALFRLYHVRPEKRYFELAQYFLEQRGYQDGEFFDNEARARGDDPATWIPPPPPGVDISYFPHPRAYWYMQANQQIRDTEKLCGHSVRSMYHLAAVQDLASLTGDKTLNEAVDRLFDNMVECHMYLHGGIGSIHVWEGYGENYELPLDGYAETCASIGILFLGQRMLQRQLSRRVAEVMERALYNNVAAGVSLDGTSFLYDQPLSTDHMKRHSWFEVCCCPPNLSRFLNSLEEYVFTVSDNTIALNLYIGSHYKSDTVEVKVSTKYPWDGHVAVQIHSETEIAFAMRQPRDTYKISASVKGSVDNGYIHFGPKKWDETIVLTFDMQPRLVKPHHLVKSTQGLVAVERGPFVYALESRDAVGPLDSVALSSSDKLSEEKVQIGGLDVISLRSGDFRLIPYFACGNRSQGEGLRVWLKDGDL
ncbi:DUF1680-domain-containing protein [Coniochaeta ligniaria NRRL 30616]|uniref:DUF1680-domain-containing protein n=1 Tax=Coniochaeta ligniaria NRRL 30616 TaxID=1408157 RepID=A0A1J7JAW1_9PEZI|nr:DUF1680-domain-containing protein [Coniochaeta ligniaria NRRL 30616]